MINYLNCSTTYVLIPLYLMDEALQLSSNVLALLSVNVFTEWTQGFWINNCLVSGRSFKTLRWYSFFRNEMTIFYTVEKDCIWTFFKSGILDFIFISMDRLGIKNLAWFRLSSKFLIVYAGTVFLVPISKELKLEVIMREHFIKNMLFFFCPGHLRVSKKNYVNFAPYIGPP